MENYIQIPQKYLIFRDDANKLTEFIRKKFQGKGKEPKMVLLDFSCVDFMSRSFIDEFLNNVNVLYKDEGIKIKLVGLKPNILDFIARVERIKNKIRALA